MIVLGEDGIGEEKGGDYEEENGCEDIGWRGEEWWLQRMLVRRKMVVGDDGELEADGW